MKRILTTLFLFFMSTSIYAYEGFEREVARLDTSLYELGVLKFEIGEYYTASFLLKMCTDISDVLKHDHGVLYLDALNKRFDCEMRIHLKGMPNEAEFYQAIMDLQTEAKDQYYKNKISQFMCEYYVTMATPFLKYINIKPDSTRNTNE